MKRIIFSLGVLLLTSCSEEKPTCITCFKDSAVVYEGCIDVYDIETVEELESIITPLFNQDYCEYN